MDDMHLLADYLNNTDVRFLYGRFCRCPTGWRDMDYLPSYSKLYYILDGEGWLRIGDNEYFPKPGELYLMPAGVKASYSAISGNTFIKYFCHFTAAVGDANLFSLVQMPAFIRVTDHDAVAVLFESLFSAANEDGPSAGLRVRSALLSLLALYVEGAGDSVRVSRAASTSDMSRVLAHINAHLSEKQTVNELAGMIHLNPNYFSKLFKKHTLITPKDYINKRRLEKAKELLLRTDLNIGDIAGQTGYADAFYFSKLFKERIGLAPSEYRNSARRER